jgi:SAM-dependent methyltransferase
MRQKADYDNFAWLYNQEWIQFPQSIFPLLKFLAGESLSRGANVLDLCCGTGQLAKILTDEGYKVTGVDISPGQLRYARKNAPLARFIKADARSFTLKQRFDTAFCTFDALNHILKIEELQQVFRNVNSNLKNGGVFVFDMNTEKEFKAHWYDNKNITDKPGFFYVIRTNYYRETKLGEFVITAFKKTGKSWERTDTRVYETFYSRAVITAALKKTGFKDIETFAANPQEGVTTPGKNATRIFYRAYKA